MADTKSPVSGISLRAILPDATIVGAEDIRVRGCSADSRHCRPGDLFAAHAGTQHDGHDYIADALAHGASALLTSRPIEGLRVPVCQVPDVADAYGRICQALAGNPGQQLKLIGITGTNGKTTTSYLAVSVLAAGGYTSGVLGTLGYWDTVDLAPARWTTPPAHVLAPWLARIAGAGCTHAVMEVSSHALAQSRVAGLEFDVACLTNIRHDHLDYHVSPADYRSSKARLFDHLKPEGIAIFNGDEECCQRMADELDGPTLTIGIDSAAEITATPIESCASEQTFLLSIGDETIPVRTSLVGRHNISNCLMAAAIGFAYGVEPSAIVRGLEAVERIAGRLERIECGQPFGVFVDYAHTADALANVLETLRSVTSGRVICVFGAGGDRDRTKRPKMGRAVECGADLAIITSDNPRTEDPAAIAAQILSGFRSRGQVDVVLDRREAIARALSIASPGDCVLIAGKGHEDQQIIGTRVEAFDDRQVARQWLYGAAQWQTLHRAA